MTERGRLILLGAGGVALIAAFVFLIHLGDRAEPDRQEVRVELKGVFKD
jgi:hypothetical protein